MGSITNWSWDNLRYFLALAQYGTLSDAARHIGVSHSTVQRRIGAFEAELQTSLFNKTAGGYTLTQAGSILFNEAAQMQTTLESISRKISGSDSAVEGNVVVTSTDTLSYLVLPAMINSLTRSYPRLSITLSMLNSISNVQNLEADIAIRTCKEPPPNLIGRKIGAVQFTAAASSTYCDEKGIDCFPADLDEHQIIMLDAGYSDTPFYQWLDARLTRNTRVTTTSGLLGAHGLCKSGLGITLLPSYMIDGDSSMQSLDTGGPSVTNELWILSHSDLRDTKRVQVVRQFLYEELSGRFG